MKTVKGSFPHSSFPSNQHRATNIGWTNYISAFAFTAATSQQIISENEVKIYFDYQDKSVICFNIQEHENKSSRWNYEIYY